MKPNESAQIEFIKDYLRKGEKRAGILVKFGKKWKNMSSTTFSRRMKVAMDSLQEELRTIETKTKATIQKEVEARKSKILTTIERQELLSMISLGKTKIRRDKFFYDSKIGSVVSQEVEELPDHIARIKAIAELNKMCGDYAPAKQEIQINELPKIIIPGNE